jgi:uncharacterized membrane protein YphA (DoxX/SURF4 family)
MLGHVDDRKRDWREQDMSQLTTNQPGRAAVDRFSPRLQQLDQRLVRWLSRYSIGALRVSLGLVFLGFGVLKFFPGASPAEELVTRTLTTLSMGAVSDYAALPVTAVAECFIGLTLVTGRWLRLGLVVLGGSLVGIMSPLILFYSDLFPGTPTLEAQYVFKDIVLVAAGLVVAARALGATLVPAGSGD